MSTNPEDQGAKKPKPKKATAGLFPTSDGSQAFGQSYKPAEENDKKDKPKTEYRGKI